MQPQHSLLRPLAVHLRWGGGCLHDVLLLLGERVHGAGGGCRQWDGEHTLDLTGVGIPHKQLVIHDAQTEGKMGPQTTDGCTPTPPTLTLLPLALSNQIPSTSLLCLSPRFLDWYLCPSPESPPLERLSTTFTWFIVSSPNQGQFRIYRLPQCKGWTVWSPFSEEDTESHRGHVNWPRSHSEWVLGQGVSA